MDSVQMPTHWDVRREEVIAKTLLTEEEPEAALDQPDEPGHSDTEQDAGSRHFQEGEAEETGWMLIDGANSAVGDGAHQVALEISAEPPPAGATALVIVIDLGGGERRAAQRHEQQPALRRPVWRRQAGRPAVLPHSTPTKQRD